MGHNVEGIRKTFFGKAPVVMDLNFFHVGRKQGSSSVGLLHESRVIRTRLRGGNVVISEIPHNHIINADSPQFPEGLEIILPYRKDSPGYHKLYRLPALHMAELERELEETRLKMAGMIEANSLQSPEQLMELVKDLLDITQKFHEKTTLVTQEAPVTVPGKPEGFTRPGER